MLFRKVQRMKWLHKQSPLLTLEVCQFSLHDSSKFPSQHSTVPLMHRVAGARVLTKTCRQIIFRIYKCKFCQSPPKEAKYGLPYAAICMPLGPTVSPPLTTAMVIQYHGLLTACYKFLSPTHMEDWDAIPYMIPVYKMLALWVTPGFLHYSFHG
jgi:hypothetical protein